VVNSAAVVAAAQTRPVRLGRSCTVFQMVLVVRVTHWLQPRERKKMLAKYGGARAAICRRTMTTNRAST
jgi:hypothetical protein